MRILNMDPVVFEEALLPDDPRLPVADLIPLGCSAEASEEEPGLRRLFEHPEELAPALRRSLA